MGSFCQNLKMEKATKKAKMEILVAFGKISKGKCLSEGKRRQPDKQERKKMFADVTKEEARYAKGKRLYAYEAKEESRQAGMDDFLYYRQ